ncbi:MAG TPA: phosphoribosyltransferase family protein [Chloroflexota bacterium]|jgi:putative phosphoribosyl transferase|nr:phosphoribosyltransferase family protein [Chloroflexota bacterium]
MDPLFQNRAAAGQALGQRLMPYAGRSDVLVLAVPRGGVPVAYAVAGALDAALDVFLVRKLGLPAEPELAMGAIASGGVSVLNDDLVRELAIPPAVIERVARQELAELERRENAYRGGRPPLNVAGRTVIVVDDGLATGATVRAAVLALRRQQPARIVVAVPVAAGAACAELRAIVEAVVCLHTPTPFSGVGRWYADFAATSDAEVRDLLRRAAQQHPASVRSLQCPSSHGG